MTARRRRSTTGHGEGKMGDLETRPAEWGRCFFRRVGRSEWRDFGFIEMYVGTGMDGYCCFCVYDNGRLSFTEGTRYVFSLYNPCKIVQ